VSQPPADTAAPPAAGALRDARDDRALAVDNALKLSASLFFTWGIALGVRLLLPRHLGPARFGDFNFADAFSATFFVGLSLGIEPYIYREVSVRPAHASDFLGGLLLARLALAAALAPVVALVLYATGRSASVQLVVWMFALVQLLLSNNATLASLLQAASRIDGLSILNVASKVAWAGGILLAMLLGGEVWTFVAPLAVTEAARMVVLWVLVRRHLGVTLRFDGAAVRRALVESLPFLATTVLLGVFAKLDVTFLAVAADRVEVGYYGAANTIGGLALLATPILGAVLLPLLARAAARSAAELEDLVRRSLELVLAAATPLSLAIALGAEVWVRLLFGPAFAPAAASLAIVAPTLLITYVNILCAYVLNVQGRAWAVTRFTLVGIAMVATFNLILLGPIIRWLGWPGAGGVACALAMLASESAVTFWMLRTVGGRVFDGRSLGRMARTGLAAVATVLVHLLAAPLGHWRLLLDAACYVGLALATGAVDVRQGVAFVRAAYRERRARSGA
jgi:O-antigen/teichoic acid export membrane protein